MKTSTLNKKRIGIGAMISILLLSIGTYAWLSGQTESLNATNSIQSSSSVNLDNGDEDIDWSSLPTSQVTLTNDTLEITAAGTYLITGQSTAGIVVRSDGDVRLALSGVNISSQSGAAVYVESAENTVIQLVDGTKNTIEDAATRADETIDGAIYSADDLIFNGEGSLTVKANFADAIVSKDDLKVSSGTYEITSSDEGLRGKDSINIVDGNINIASTGDGIKATNDTDVDKGYVYIKGGSVTINSEDQGVHAITSVIIDGGTLAVESSTEGIEATNVTINDGSVTVNADDDGINASSNSTSEEVYIEVNGGTVDVTVGNGDTDAFDANGDIYIKGGAVTVTAPISSFDYDGVAEFTGGTITVNGEQVSEIPELHMGGGPPMR